MTHLNSTTIPIEIDGSYREGGGQILRSATAFSCLLARPVKIIKIRHNRPKPGLAASHLEAISLVCNICGSDATLENAKLGSTEVILWPGGIPQQLQGNFDQSCQDVAMSSNIDQNETVVIDSEAVSDQNFPLARTSSIFGRNQLEANCSTAGSITLMLQAAIFPALMVGAQKIKFSGGTDVDFSPPLSYMQDVLLKVYQCLFFSGPNNLKKISTNLTVQKRGYFPQGGGKAEFDVKLDQDSQSCPDNMQSDNVGTDIIDQNSQSSYLPDDIFPLAAFDWIKNPKFLKNQVKQEPENPFGTNHYVDQDLAQPESDAQKNSVTWLRKIHVKCYGSLPGDCSAWRELRKRYGSSQSLHSLQSEILKPGGPTRSFVATDGNINKAVQSELSKSEYSDPILKKFTITDSAEPYGPTQTVIEDSDRCLDWHFRFPDSSQKSFGSDGQQCKPISFSFDIFPDQNDCSWKGFSSGGISISIAVVSNEGSYYYGSAVDSLRNVKKGGNKGEKNNKGNGKGKFKGKNNKNNYAEQNQMQCKNNPTDSINNEDSDTILTDFVIDVFRRALQDLRNCLWHCVIDPSKKFQSSSLKGPNTIEIDPHLQDNLILPMALACGVSRIECGELTEHTKSGIYVAEKMTGCKFWQEASEVQQYQDNSSSDVICNTQDKQTHQSLILCCNGIGFFVKTFNCRMALKMNSALGQAETMVSSESEEESSVSYMSKNVKAHALGQDLIELERIYQSGYLKIDVKWDDFKELGEITIRVKGSSRLLEGVCLPETGDWKHKFANILGHYHLNIV